MSGDKFAVGVSWPWSNCPDYCEIKALAYLIKHLLYMHSNLIWCIHASTMEMTTRSLSIPGNSTQLAREIMLWPTCMMVAHCSHRTVQVLQVSTMLFIGLLCNTPVLSVVLWYSENYFRSANTWSLYMTTADYQSSFSFEYIIHVSIVRYCLHVIKNITNVSQCRDSKTAKSRKTR